MENIKKNVNVPNADKKQLQDVQGRYATKHDVVDDVDLTTTTLLPIVQSREPLLRLGPTPGSSAVRNTTGKGSKQSLDGPPGFMPDDKLREFCDKHYDQLLPLMAEKVHQEKLHGVQARLSFEGSSRKNSQTQEKSQYSELESFDRKKKSKKGEGPARTPCPEAPIPSRVHTSAKRIARDPDRRSREAKSLIQSYVTCSSKRQREIEQEWNAVDRANRRMLIPAREATLSESKNSRGGHWKSRPKKLKSSTDEDDLSQPWLCEEMDPFTPRIRNFVFPKRIHMPSNVRIYDGTGDPEDHLKNFQTAAKVIMRPMFGAFGRAGSANSIAFVSKVQTYIRKCA
ncbi:hypothetical protein Tco_1400224 [Tanacetum coccineum]